MLVQSSLTTTQCKCTNINSTIDNNTNILINFHVFLRICLSLIDRKFDDEIMNFYNSNNLIFEQNVHNELEHVFRNSIISNTFLHKNCIFASIASNQKDHLPLNSQKQNFSA